MNFAFHVGDVDAATAPEGDVEDTFLDRTPSSRLRMASSSSTLRLARRYCSWLRFSVGLTSYRQSASELAQFAHVGETPSHFCFLALQRRQATAVRARFRAAFDFAALGEVADRSMVEMQVWPSLPEGSGYYMSLPSGVHRGRRRARCGEDCGQRGDKGLVPCLSFGRAEVAPMETARDIEHD